MLFYLKGGVRGSCKQVVYGDRNRNRNREHRQTDRQTDRHIHTHTHTDTHTLSLSRNVFHGHCCWLRPTQPNPTAASGSVNCRGCRTSSLTFSGCSFVLIHGQFYALKSQCQVQLVKGLVYWFSELYPLSHLWSSGIW